MCDDDVPAFSFWSDFEMVEIVGGKGKRGHRGEMCCFPGWFCFYIAPWSDAYFSYRPDRLIIRLVFGYFLVIFLGKTPLIKHMEVCVCIYVVKHESEAEYTCKCLLLNVFDDMSRLYLMSCGREACNVASSQVA